MKDDIGEQNRLGYVEYLKIYGLTVVVNYDYRAEKE
jgi:hypothetical protein